MATSTYRSSYIYEEQNYLMKMKWIALTFDMLNIIENGNICQCDWERGGNKLLIL